MNKIKILIHEAQELKLGLYDLWGDAFDIYLHMVSLTRDEKVKEHYTNDFLAAVPELRAHLNKQLALIERAVAIVGEKQVNKVEGWFNYRENAAIKQNAFDKITGLNCDNVSNIYKTKEEAALDKDHADSKQMYGVFTFEEKTLREGENNEPL